MNPCRQALELLRKDGWWQGSHRGPNGEHCMADALSRSCKSWDDTKLAFGAVRLLIDDNPIIDFNDAPDTTFPKVERVLLDAADRYDALMAEESE